MSLDTDSKIKVFISYAHEDRQKAEILFTNLKDYNLDPWLDEESLKAGERWELKIKEAIKSSRYFIPLLSKKSTEPGGYVQKEFDDALKYLNEYPENDIYIIPVRLDDCKIPESKIQELHIVDLFPYWNKGVEKILSAMGIQEKPDILEPEYWNNLLTDIREENCIPFVGNGSLEIFNRVNDRAFFTNEEIALDWAEKFRYPLEEPFELSKVAQYVAIEKTDDNFPKMTLSNKLKENLTPDFENKYENSVHAVLAQLDLPIYITTNYDLYIEEALKSQRKEPRSECCVWNSRLRKQRKNTTLPSAFDKKSGYKPTKQAPLIYHLHGSIEHPQSIVLTERDHFEFVINMNKTEQQQEIPTLIRKKIPSSTLLFLGYKLDDINFRSILQGALSFCESLSDMKSSIAVIQIPYVQDLARREKIKKYLKRYTKDMFQIIVYWGTMDEFVKELSKNWKQFKANQLNPGGN